MIVEAVSPVRVRLSPKESWIIVADPLLLLACERTAARSCAWVMLAVRYENEDVASWIVSAFVPEAMKPLIVSDPKFEPNRNVSDPLASP